MGKPTHPTSTILDHFLRVTPRFEENGSRTLALMPPERLPSAPSTPVT